MSYKVCLSVMFVFPFRKLTIVLQYHSRALVFNSKNLIRLWDVGE